jgi:hypothetical protein
MTITEQVICGSSSVFRNAAYATGWRILPQVRFLLNVRATSTDTKHATSAHVGPQLWTDFEGLVLVLARDLVNIPIRKKDDTVQQGHNYTNNYDCCLDSRPLPAITELQAQMYFWSHKKTVYQLIASNEWQIARPEKRSQQRI